MVSSQVLVRSSALLLLLSVPIGAAHPQSGFGPATSLPTGLGSISKVVVADYDNDGDLDVLAAGYWDNMVIGIPNQAAGSLGQPVTLGSNLFHPEDLECLDLDEDGLADLLLVGGQSGLYWRKGLGGGAFATKAQLPAFNNLVVAVEAADLDLDGELDLVVGSDPMTSSTHPEARIFRDLGQAPASFGAPLALSQTEAADLRPRQVQLADLDGDGLLDILYLAGNVGPSKYLAWHRNLGSGNFNVRKIFTGGASTYFGFTTEDLNGDGLPDLVAGYGTGSWPVFPGKLVWFQNVSTSTAIGFSNETQLPGEAFEAYGARSIHFSDLDLDGDRDVVVVSPYLGTVSWLERVGPTSFLDPVVIASGLSFPYASALGDFDSDGDDDLVVGDLKDGQILYFENLMLVDCNSNGVHDFADIANGTSLDCNGNGVPDECDPDCDGNGVPDDCDLAGGGVDCNGNAVPDVCDILLGTSFDIDLDGVPDECAPPPLTANTYHLSVAAGGIQAFTLRGPKAFELYFLAGSTSGTSPGILVGGLTVPLNLDSYLLHALNSPGAPPLSGAFGLLTPGPGGGMATATFTLPPAFSPSIVGMTLHHAFVTIDLQTAGYTSVSNAVPLLLAP